MDFKLIYRVVWLQICFVGIFGSLFAQDKVVYGVINAFDSIPLPDARIYVKSTKETYYSDKEGNFTAICNKKDKLNISATGFQKQKVRVGEGVKIVAVNLKLKAGADPMDYDIGYGHVSEKDRTTATTSLAKNEASFSRYSDIYDMIEGQFPGVEVRNEEIIIRGNSSFNSSSAALIVLDGVIVEPDLLRSLRPVQVKNISIIKDGSAAVYGSRGANGVVLIETRKGGDHIK